MPLLHLPVVHKFGIISHSRRLELQERLLQAALQDGKEKEGFQSKKNPFEVTDAFIKKYNSTQSITEKAACEAEAQRLLSRVKRRAGLRGGGVGQHVNLPFAWTELVFLAHCRGRVHQDALDTLVLSLEQAPVGYYQIPALFYIAETVLYWLQSESPASDALRSAEVKSLRVGQVTFLRLFYHHMTGQLRRHAESRSRLALYLKEFPQLASLYAAYPDVAFCHSFIVAVGGVIASAASSATVDEAVAEAEPAADGAAASPELRSLVTAEVHELSPLLWHALDVWRCARHLGGDLDGALDGLLECSVGMAQQGNWIDTYLALLIVGNAACEDVECLKAFLELGADREIVVGDGDQYASEHRRESRTAAASATAATQLGASNQSAAVAEAEEDASVVTTTFPALSNHGNAASDREVAGEPQPPPQERPAGRYPVGLATWPWELAAGFVQQLTRVCLDGESSSSRQRALTADQSCSLTALALRRVDTDADAGAPDTCWRIRYLALQGLAIVAKSAAKDDLRRCLSEAAWPVLEQSQRRERLGQVLEGLPLAAVWADLAQLAAAETPSKSGGSGLVGHVAYALTLVYLPALPPPVSLLPATGRGGPGAGTGAGRLQVGAAARPAPTPAAAAAPAGRRLRTSLRQEIALSAANAKPAADFSVRRGFELRRVVEDQWRKQAQGQLEMENATREEMLRMKVNE